MPNSKAPRALPRFTVSYLLGVTTALALLLAPIAPLGLGYAAHVLLLCLMLAMALVALAIRRLVWAAITCGLFALLGMLLLSGTIFLTALATLLVILGTTRLDNRELRAALIYVTVLIGVWGPYAETARKLRNLDALRKEFAFQSITQRLPIATPPMVEVPGQLSPEVENNLKQFQLFRNSSRGRARALERLHSESYRRFVASPGFGFSRMGPMTAWRFELGEIDTRVLPMPLDPAYGPKPDELRNWALQRMFDSDASGVVRSRDEVAGFGAHAFRRNELEDTEFNENPVWRLDRLELIGLLNHSEPVAYVSDQLPRMDILKQFETRPLDDFETIALERIRWEQDIEISESGSRVRMLGAIRAVKDCLVCHDTTRGTLLGAFSYTLTRLPAKQTTDSPAGVEPSP